MEKVFEHFKSRRTNEYLRELREQHHHNKNIIKENQKYVLHPSVRDLLKRSD